ncbi:cytochrome P450 [Streptomyces sp. NPDC006012]|uniref:cytochrome P450 n=1 Tax=Streptomyces sp. NPDC006012 TaxID=3364739 RepID=UPI0036A86CC1
MNAPEGSAAAEAGGTPAISFEAEDFSFSNPELFVDPYPIYRQIREREPFHRSRMYGGSWILFAYEDAAALLRSDKLTNNRANLPLLALAESERAEFSGFVDFLRTWTAFHEGEEHMLRRNRMDEVFRVLTPAVVGRVVQEAAADLIDRWGDRSRVDLVADYARPLPAMVLTRLMGAPESDHHLLDEWADDLAYLFGTNDLAADDVRRAQKSAEAFMAYLQDLAADLARLPKSSILAGLLAQEGSAFNFELAQACAQCVLLMFAGLEPSRHIIGSAVLALEQFPDQRSLLEENPRLWPSAVEEFLRFDPPVQYIGRLAAEDFSYRGHEIRKGQAVLPFVGSANRDPKQFPDPDVLDVRRRARHLSMGEGVHRCIGAGMVRVQTSIALRTLLSRKPQLRVCPETRPVWHSYSGFHGLKSLVVSV